MSELLNRESVKKVKTILSNFDKSIEIQILEHTAKTAIEAAKALKCKAGAIVKSLLIKTDDAFIMCLISGDKKCSLKKIKILTGKKDVCMANAEAVKKVTSFSIGGVSPVGHNEKIEIIIDKQLSRYKTIFAAAGHPNAIFPIDLYNLIKITKGSLEDISE